MLCFKAFHLGGPSFPGKKNEGDFWDGKEMFVIAELLRTVE